MSKNENKVNRSTLRSSNTGGGTSKHTQEQEEYRVLAQGDQEVVAARKRKRIKIAGLVALIVLVVAGATVGIVFATKGSGDDPGPSPPTPVEPGYNPYKVNQSTITEQKSTVSGLLQFDQVTHQKFKDLRQNQKAGFEQGLKDKKTFKVDPLDIANGVNNQVIENVTFEFAQSGFTQAFLSLKDANNSNRWDIPEDLVPKMHEDDNFRLEMSGLHVSYDPFEFYFQDTSSNEILIDSRKQAFVFEDKFMQIDFKLPTQKIYGLGERSREFWLSEGAWTMFANGQETPYDNGTGGKQIYGVHPFALVKAKAAGQFFGIFFRNSNAQAVVTTFNDDGTTTLSYMTTGGNLDVYFFFKGSAKEIIQQYQQFIGLPTLTPLWSLGWHASAYAYFNLSMVDEAVTGYLANDVPLEGVWFDIKYMDDYKDFTVDNTNWKDLKNYTDYHRKTNHIKFIPIIDAGLSNDSYPNKYVEAAKAKDALLMSNDSVFSAQVWPHNATFLDWFNPDSKGIWSQGFQDLYQEFEYDGIWLDMNEATLFCNGTWPYCWDPNGGNGAKKEQSRVQPFESIEKRRLKDLFFKEGEQHLADVSAKDDAWYSGYDDSFMGNESFFFLPFIPMKQNLDNMSIPMNVTHPKSGYLQFNTHSLYGHMEAKTTKEIFDAGEVAGLKGKRTFLLSRSTFAGSGKYTQHWLGDNHRTWANMRYSIAGTMNMNMFGIPMIGPDTCGFFSTPEFNETQEQEICGRWIQLATFFPFARQHRDKYPGGGNPNEPYKLGNYSAMAREAIFDRYRYVKFMYTCLFEASKTGKTCYDPILFHYPDLDGAYTDTEQTFLVGDAIKVSPVLMSKENMTDNKFDVFFPQGKWIDLDNPATGIITVEEEEGKFVTLQANDHGVIKHLRPGYLIPRQSRVLQSDSLKVQPPLLPLINNTDQVPLSPVELLVNQDVQGYAKGRVLFDNGTNSDDLTQGNYSFFEFTVTKNSIQKTNLYDGTNYPGFDSYLNYGISTIYLLDSFEKSHYDFACMVEEGQQPWGEPMELQIRYDNQTGAVLIMSKDQVDKLDPMNAFKMKSIYFGNKLADADVASICYPTVGDYKYQVQGEMPSLDANNVTLNLTVAGKNGKPDILMNISVAQDISDPSKAGFLKFEWNYAKEQSPNVKQPFKVPESVVNTSSLVLCETCKLSDLITVKQDKEVGPLIRIKSKKKADRDVFRLDDVIFGEYRNDMLMQLVTNNETKPQRGRIIGLNDGVTDKLVQPPKGQHSFWSLDTPDPVDQGGSPSSNDYNVHPFFAYTASDDQVYGVFANVANAQDWYLNNDESQDYQTVNMASTGGLGQLIFIFESENKSELGYENIVKFGYHHIIGKPVLVPRWGLGWNQCRYGWKSLDVVKDVLKNYKENGLALDVIWNDIDYLNDYQDWTFDPVYFKGLGEFVQDIHNNSNQRYIPIIDAGISKRDNQGYKAYDDGIKADVFIKAHAGSDEPFIGRVWPTDAVYPDFFKNQTVQWWMDQMSDFFSKVNFDGVWLDMNEASNFCNGACYTSQQATYPAKKNLIFQYTGRDLETKSMPLDAIHHNGETQLDVHSLFGAMQQRATHQWFVENNKRTMIIARSTFSGSGKFASRWLGDNFAQLEYLGYSVNGVQLSNIFGIPFVGADICGFIGQTTQELCTRWHFVGAFYPFSRNHHDEKSEQEPYQFKEIYQVTGKTFMAHMSDAIRYKYALIPYYYTQLNQISREGGTLFRAPFFSFPADEMAYENTTNNFMLGDALKVSIQSTENVTETLYYFPNASDIPTQWCNVFNATKELCFEGGVQKTYDSFLHNFDVHIRSNSIVPLHDPFTAQNMTNTTVDVVNSRTNLHIHPQCSGSTCSASGSYQGDDGETIDSASRYIVVAKLGFEAPYDEEATDPTQSFNVTVKQDQVVGDQWHECDNIGSIVIYNAKRSKMNADYDIDIKFTNSSVVTVQKGAIYNETTDQLVFSHNTGVGSEFAYLNKIQFTLSAP